MVDLSDGQGTRRFYRRLWVRILAMCGGFAALRVTILSVMSSEFMHRCRKPLRLAAGALSLILATMADPAFGHLQTYQGAVLFTPGGPTQSSISLPTFDGQDGVRELTGVTVDLYESASAEILVDNDGGSPLAAAGRIQRRWEIIGPGVFNHRISDAEAQAVILYGDDGDGDVLDASLPDGTDFGGSIGYEMRSGGSWNPHVSLYNTNAFGPARFDLTLYEIIDEPGFFAEPTEPTQWTATNSWLRLDLALAYEFDLHAFPGDTNLDAQVDMADLTTLARHYGDTTSAKQWRDGDFTWDGRVDLSDLCVLARSWTGGATHIPEPASFVAWLTALGWLGRRRPE